jgi:hypothetical protein
MSMTENKTVGEIHGCIVCGRTFNILAVYSPAGILVDCTVTSPGGQIVPDHQQPLAACSRHTADEIDVAYKKWQASKSKKSEYDQEDQ